MLERQKIYLNTFTEGKDIDEFFNENFRRNKVKISTVNQIKAKITKITECKFYSDIEFIFENFTFIDRANTQSIVDLKLEVGKEITFVFKSTNITLSNYKEETKLSDNQMVAKVYQLQFSQDYAQVDLVTNEENFISAIISIQDYNELDIKFNSTLIVTVDKEHIFISL